MFFTVFLLFFCSLFCTCSLKSADIGFTSSSQSSLPVILDHSNPHRLQTFHHGWQRPINKEEFIHCAHSFNTGIFHMWTTFYRRYFYPSSRRTSNTVYADAGAASLNKRKLMEIVVYSLWYWKSRPPYP